MDANSLLDQMHFALNEQAWTEFKQVLNSPTANPALQELLAREPVWNPSLSSPIGGSGE